MNIYRYFALHFFVLTATRFFSIWELLRNDIFFFLSDKYILFSCQFMRGRAIAHITSRVGRTDGRVIPRRGPNDNTRNGYVSLGGRDVLPPHPPPTPYGSIVLRVIAHPPAEFQVLPPARDSKRSPARTFSECILRKFLYYPKPLENWRIALAVSRFHLQPLKGQLQLFRNAKNDK